jgi:uncharacterized repeat protein (TIGR01451 family)
MTVDGSTVVDVGQFRAINISYTWSSLTQNLSNAQIVVDLPATLDTDSTSDVQVYGSAHTTVAAYDPSTRKITYTFTDPLPAGSSGTLQYFVRFPTSAADGTLAQINATSSGTGQPNGTDSVTLEANVNTSTNIVITKSADKYPMLGQNVTYTLKLKNKGTTSMNSPVIVDQLPTGTTYVSSDNSGSYNPTTQRVTWNLPTLAAGNTIVVKVTVSYNSPTFSVGQWVNNTATGTGTDSLGAPVNVSTNTSVQIVAPSPGANADKWDSIDPVSLKGNFYYMFWVRNSGNVPLTNYSFTDDFPKEFIPTIIYPGSDNSGTHTSTINVWFKTNTNSTWRLVPGSPFVTNPRTDPAVYTADMGLASNEIVSSVKYEFGNLPVGYDGSWRPRVLGHMGQPTTGLDRNGAAITGLPKTVSNTYNIAYTYSDTNYTASDTETTQLMAASPVPYFIVYDPTPTSYIPLQEIKWTFRMENDWSGSDALINPVYATLLPETLEYVPGSLEMVEGPFSAPTVTVTNNHNGTGRQLVKFTFTGNQQPEWTEVGGQWDDWVVYMDFKTKVKPGAQAGADSIEYHLLSTGNTVINDVYVQGMRADVNDLDGDSNTTELLRSSNYGYFSINSSTAIDSVLWVKGELDSAFNRYPDAGFARPGGSMQYKLIVTNPGNIPLTGIRVMDILPHVGDLGVILHSQARGSNFGLSLSSTVTAPAGITVKYSASTNPVRTDLDATLTSPAGAQSGTFSTTPPATLSDTKSLLFDFGSLVLNPGESKEIVWNMTVPAGAAAGQVAWNSFGHRSQSAATGTPLPPSEPIKTGIAVPFTIGSFVWNDLDSDGTQDAGEPGIPGATLQIFKSDGTPALDMLGGTVPSVTTDANGVYAFSALADGDYFVRVTAPSQYIPTNNQVPDPDDDVDTDSNIDLSRTPPAGSYESGIFTFAVNTEPIIEPGAGGTQDDVDDNNGNMTVDFGFRIIPNDYGDFSGFADASSAISAAIRLGGTATDSESSATKNSTATGDDTTGSDDEDGVTFGSLRQGQPASVTVSRTNSSGSNVFLNAWVDFDNDGSMSGAGEQIISNVIIPTGTSGSQVYSFAVPSNATVASVGARFRITTTSNPGPTGASGNGEVEDVVASIQPGLSIGNLIWNDVNHNGIKDAAESGLSGVTVQLFDPGANGIIGGGGAAADTQVGASFVTTSSGAYSFTGLVPGIYFIKVTPPAGYVTGGTPATTDNDVDNNNDGAQPGGVSTALFSPIIDLTNGAESITDGDTDPNTNLTVDFGLFAGIQLGSHVWHDVNDNGMKDGGESAISGLQVDLLNDGTGAVLATTSTNGSGQYAFTVYSAGNYRVSVTPNATLPLASTTYVTEDNAVDNDNNGYQPGIKGTASSSAMITLTPAGEPGSSGSANVENTIDFGFRSCPAVTVASSPTPPDTAVMRRAYTMQMSASGGIAPHAFSVTAGSLPPGLVLYPNGQISGAPTATGTYNATITASDVKTCTGQMDVQIEVLPPLSIGNLVFYDSNSDGNADTGEGVAGVTVQLYTSTQTPGTDTPVTTLTTGTDGGYLFEGLYPGLYRVHIPAAMFATGAPLAGMISIAEGLTGDDDAGEDGINSLTPEASGISTGVISLTVGTAPTDENGETGFNATSDNDYDAAINLSIDLGFAGPLGVGNMVFNDADGDGKYDSGEGVGAVTVRLYHAADVPGVSPPVAEMETDSAGRYFFDYLMGGDYFVFIPAVEFASGGQLQGKLSVAGAGTGALDDNADENGLDGMSPQADGVRSNTFTLGNNTEPTNAGGETGYLNNEDGRDDNNYDLTIDLGFAAPNPTSVGIGNLVFLDGNGNGVFDTGEGVAGVNVCLFASTANVQTDTPMATAVTGSGGLYSFANLNAGSYIVHIPASEFASGRPLHGKMSILDHGGDTGLDDDTDENGVDAANPSLTGISSEVVTLTAGAEPMDNTTEFGEGFYMDVVDANADLTVDFGFLSAAGVGNLVYRDLNENGHADAGEGVAAVRVELYQEGYYPLFDTPFATTTTDSGGKYRFENLPPGNYFIWVPSSEFGIGRPLHQAVSIEGVQSGDDDAGDDGVDEPQPVIFGVSSTLFTLSAISSPVGTAESGIGGSEDDATDASVDMTVDLGFTQPPPMSVSGQVRNDLDRDGDFLDMDEPLRNVTMRLYYDANQDLSLDELDPLVATTTTGAGGGYTFTGVTDGGYFILEVDPAGVLSTNDTYDLNDNVIYVVVNGAHVTGNDFLDAIDPQGYIYDPTSGLLVTGGTISVTGPGTVTVLMDGSSGAYAWVKDEDSTGLYTLNYTPPPGKSVDDARPAQLVALDPTGQASPYPIGSGLNLGGTQLLNFSAAANPWHTTYDLSPGDPLTSQNNIPVISLSAGSWAGWQYNNPLGGQNGPAQNPDGDAHDNLQEFAFKLNPSSGVTGGVWPLQVVHNKADGTIDAKVRRVTGLTGVLLKLQGIAALSSSPSGWFDITTIMPSVTTNGDGSETLLYANLAQVAALSGGRGFLRVHLSLDADGNGSYETISKTGVCGWTTRAFTQSMETASSPFLSPPVFSGAVGSVSGLAFDLTASLGGGNLVGSLTAGKQYFIEVTSGDHVGHRVDVDEAASTTAGVLTVDATSGQNTFAVGNALPSTLAADKITVREHQTIGGVFDRTLFAHTNSPATADRMLFFNRSTNTYTTYWLYRNSGDPKWVRSGDATLADAGTRVLGAAEGLFLNPRAAAVSITFTGEVRANAFACPLGVGTQLVANPWPADSTPAQRPMSTSTGFRGTSSSSSADQIRLWVGDTTTGQQGYTTYYYCKFLLYDQWTRQGDALLGNQNNTALFKGTKSVFIRSVLGNGPWVMACPWTP